MPELRPGQVRVKVECCGLCHTDIHAANGDWPTKPSPPFRPGDEGVGIVTELGLGVSDVENGDRVATPWLGYACGSCDYCVDGWETLCLEQEMMGYTIDGGWGEYAIAFARYVVKVPDGVSGAASHGAQALSKSRWVAAAWRLCHNPEDVRCRSRRALQAR